MSIRRTLAAVCLALAASAAADAQSTLPDAVREAVNEGAGLYRAGRSVEAREKYRRPSAGRDREKEKQDAAPRPAGEPDPSL